MRKTTREKVSIENVEVIDIAEGGKGVGKTDDLVIFIQHAIPGDIVDIEIQKKKKILAEATVTALKQASPYRVEAFCKHFGVCGGCKWQNMEYDAQLLYKQKSVENALSRIGKVDTSQMEEILPSGQDRK